MIKSLIRAEEQFVDKMLKSILSRDPTFADYQEVHIIHQIGKGKPRLVYYNNEKFGELTIEIIELQVETTFNKL